MSLPDTSQTSWYDWDSQDGCGNPYADSSFDLSQASESENLGRVMQVLQRSGPTDALDP